jgi:hypothetical protein
MSSVAFNLSTPSNVTQMAATARTGPAPAEPTPAASEPAPAASEDTVTLSASAQAEALYHGGQSVASIASSLGTSVQLVDSYLSITPTVAVAVSAAPAVHSAPAAHVASATAAAPAAQATPVAATELPKAVAKG